jgi:hypothetical protein
MDSAGRTSGQHALLQEHLPIRWRLRLHSSWWWRVLGAAFFVSILFNLTILRQNYNRRPGSMPIVLTKVPLSSHRIEDFEKPKDFRIVGLIFAGRRDRLSILDCYLQVRDCHPIENISPPPS